MKTRKVWGITGILLVLALAFAGCPGDVSSGGEDEPDVVTNAVTPQFQTQPQSKDYKIGATTITPLTVAVREPSDKGTISLQWYSNTTASTTGGTLISGVTGTTYTPPLSTAAPVTAYYYVVATNYNKNATNNKSISRASNIATIRIILEPPVINTQPKSGTYRVNDIVSLTVDASLESGSGNLSYQWYSNTVRSSIGGTEIPEATGETYSPSTASAGMYYYYVVITNTAGTNQESVTSDVVQIGIAVDNFDTLTANVTLTINNSAGNRYQYVRGYGGMSDVEFRSNAGSPSPDMTADDAHKVFNKEPIVWNSTQGVVSGGLGLNIMRTIMYDDLDGVVGNTVRGPGPGGNLAPAPAGWIRDNSDYFDIIKAVNSHGAYVILCPWTPPVEFKASGATLNQGSINAATFPQLAQYFKNYLQRLTDEGAPVFAVSIQNEPNISGAYESARWDSPNTNERDFIRILGPILADFPGYGGGKWHDKVWLGPGEDSGAPSQSQTNVVNDTGADGASQWIEFVPRHFYGNMQTRYATGINARKEVWATEHTDTTNANRDSSYSQMSTWNWVWHVANELYCSTGLNDESAYVFWYIKRFYGFLGDSSQGTTWSAILPRGMVMSHFSKYAADTRRVRVSASGSFFSNAGTNAGSGSSGLTGTTLPVTSSNLNPTSFSSGNNDSNGQNQPTTKVMAFESMDGNSIVVIAFTPTRNSGAGGQDAGTVQINLPSGFVATNAELMRSNANVRHQMETVTLNRAGTAAKISLPRSNIVSVKFTK